MTSEESRTAFGTCRAPPRWASAGRGAEEGQEREERERPQGTAKRRRIPQSAATHCKALQRRRKTGRKKLTPQSAPSRSIEKQNSLCHRLDAKSHWKREKSLAHVRELRERGGVSCNKLVDALDMFTDSRGSSQKWRAAIIFLKLDSLICIRWLGYTDTWDEVLDLSIDEDARRIAAQGTHVSAETLARQKQRAQTRTSIPPQEASMLSLRGMTASLGGVSRRG